MITEVTILVLKSDSEAIIRWYVKCLNTNLLLKKIIVSVTHSYHVFAVFLFKERDSEGLSKCINPLSSLWPLKFNNIKNLSYLCQVNHSVWVKIVE